MIHWGSFSLKNLVLSSFVVDFAVVVLTESQTGAQSGTLGHCRMFGRVGYKANSDLPLIFTPEY